MNINDFKSNFNGGARPTLFKVVQIFPNAINGLAGRKMEFLCKGAALPGSDVGSVQIPYMGFNLKYAGDRTYEDMTLTIINDTDFALRTAYELWMNIIRKPDGSGGAVNARDYWSDMFITQLGRDGSMLRTYRLVSGFPVNISTIDLSYESTDQIEEFTITYSYQYWQNEAVF